MQRARNSIFIQRYSRQSVRVSCFRRRIISSKSTDNHHNNNINTLHSAIDDRKNKNEQIIWFLFVCCSLPLFLRRLSNSFFSLYSLSLPLDVVCFLFWIFGAHINSRENNNVVNWHSPSPSSSSEDDAANSPTQMNNCRKFIDKAPLVKRLSISLLRSAEQYRPLINNFGNFSMASSTAATTKATATVTVTTPTKTTKLTSTTTNNYLTASTTHIPNVTTNVSCTNDTNDGNSTMCYGDTDEIISSKFGDSCRKSLTSVLDNRRKDYCEFDLKRNFLRETSSGKFSYQINLHFAAFACSILHLFDSAEHTHSPSCPLPLSPHNIFLGIPSVCFSACVCAQHSKQHCLMFFHSLFFFLLSFTLMLLSSTT